MLEARPAVIRRTGLVSLGAAGVLLGVSALSNPYSQGIKAEDTQLFEAKIRPLFIEKCVVCHGSEQQKGGIRLDVRDGFQKAAIVAPGNPDNSRLIRAVHYDGIIKMPPSGKLSPQEIEALTDWVKRGAIWPEARPVGPDPHPTKSSPLVLTQAQKNFWSFRPVRRPSLPVVKNRSWIKSPIDAFVLSRLEAQGLTPAPRADKRTLLRRVTFDLTGLPPTLEEMAAFLADASPNAYAKVVDRLLASPRYGERWARHWLDVARYCDSTDARGLGSEGDIAYAWRYRDWVVDAFNNDLPYNLFVMNQVAGDLMTQPSAPFNRAGTIATGFLAVGNWGNGDADKDKILTDIADDQVDAVSRGFLGLTVACARCHNHKFDPLSTQDYYGLAGIFFSSHILPKLTPKGQGEVMLRIPLASPAEMEARTKYATDLAALEKQVGAVRETAYAEQAKALLPQTANYLTAAWDYRHRPTEQAAMTLDDYAAKHGLAGYALRQWMDFLGLGDYRLMKMAQRDVLNSPGVQGYRGEADTPSLLVNTNNDPRALLTFTIPPHAVTVHPGPASGVAVCWRSPIGGTVRVSGKVADADPAGGDGIAWEIAVRTSAGARTLASGGFENGGSQALEAGSDATRLTTVTVRPGDKIELRVLPKTSHTCDTTVVELNVTETAGKRVWNLAHDILDNLHSGNPHNDSLGNPAVWEFADMAGSRPSALPPALRDAYAGWEQALNVPDGAPSHEVVEKAAQSFAKAFTIADRNSPFWINGTQDEATLPPTARQQIATLAQALETKRKAMPPPLEYANGALEGGVPESPQAGVHDVNVHIRGNYARLGERVPRRFPTVLAGDKQPPITHGSGRLELAQWLVGDKNPLTARVIVNRIWQGHFGEGIVRTPSNFGFLGERPTHPELLDWLAATFVARDEDKGMRDEKHPSSSLIPHPSSLALGWSLKKLHRLILLSNTYQQSSQASAKALQTDPDNRLFSRMNRRRLEAEELRDSLLAVAGRLDTTMGGVAYRDFNTPRRTLYYMTIRSDRSGYGPLFDMADSTSQVDRRVASTVAPQALFLLNNAFALEQAKNLAKRLLAEKPATNGGDATRIEQVYRLLYGRAPSAEEARIGQTFLAHSRRTKTTKVAGQGAVDLELNVWKAYCQILLCANEFMYLD